MTLEPLNGTKTHPLTRHALATLRELALHGPRPTQKVNPGQVNRFHREGLTETVKLPSPFATHRGGLIDHEQITDAGRALLTE